MWNSRWVASINTWIGSREQASHSCLETIIDAIHRRGIDSLHSLTAVSNNAGTAIGGGLSPLVKSGQLTKCICSFLGNNKELEKRYLTGKIAIELCPQGSLAERLRAGGAGVPAFYTPTGVRTWNSPTLLSTLPVRLRQDTDSV